jgi:Sulfotransferase family
MPVYEGRGRRVLFVHIPKTGGTSIEAAFRRAGFEESYRSKSFTARGCRPQHLTATDLVDEFPGLPFDYVFAVVRDPVARLGSERVWRAGHVAKSGAPVPDFESFATTWLDRYDADPTAGDNHFRPQLEFLLPQMDVFRFEDGIEWIMSRVGARVGAPRLHGRVPHRMGPRVDADRSLDSLTAGTRARLARLYLADCAVLGYPQSFDPSIAGGGVSWRSPHDD